jgi:hypothetical protein
MAFISVPSVPGWGKLASRLSGARGPPLSPGRGRRAWVCGQSPHCRRSLHGGCLGPIRGPGENTVAPMPWLNQQCQRNVTPL